jgi:hypothetical protein
LKGVAYAQLRIPGNTEQYYLAGTENGGWKVNILGRNNSKFICRVLYLFLKKTLRYNIIIYVTLSIEIRLVDSGMEMLNHWFTTMLK